MADQGIQNFYDLTYLPVIDDTFKTRATSTNFTGGFAEIRITDQSLWRDNQNLSDVGEFLFNSSNGFISDNFTIKAGTYYFEYLQIRGSYEGLTFNSMSQGEVVYGFRRNVHYMHKDSVSMILSLVIRFTSDTRLNTGPMGSINSFIRLFITPYDSDESSIQDFNKLKYMPSDERDTLSRGMVAGEYISIGPNSFRGVSDTIGGNDLYGDLPPSGEPYELDTEMYDYGYYRIYSMNQRRDPLYGTFESPIGYGSVVVPQTQVLRGSGINSGVTVRVTSPVTFGIDIYGCWYGARLCDYETYDPDNVYEYSLETFIPSYRKNFSPFIDRVATLDRTVSGEPSSYINIKRVSIGGGNPIISGLNNWVFNTSATAMIVTINFIDDYEKTVKLVHIDGNNDLHEHYIGYDQPTVMIPTIGSNSKGFSLETTDSSPLGKFWMTAVFLP